MKPTKSLNQIPQLVIAAIALFLVSCGRRELIDHANDPQPSAKAANTTPSSLGSEMPRSKLAAAINRLSQYTKKTTPADRQAVTSQPITNRVEWKLQALLDGHVRSGYSSSATAPAVSNLFRQYAEYSSGNPIVTIAFKEALKAAVALESKDPFIDYMVTRYLRADTNSNMEVAISLTDFVGRLQQSSHHPFFRFMASYRATSYGLAADRSVPLSFLLDVTSFSLEDMAMDENIPPLELYEAASMWMDFSTSNDWLPWVMRNFEAILDDRWSGSGWYYELKGRSEIGRAWNARGNTFADKVTDQMNARFEAHLAKAQKHLEAGWAITTNRIRIAREMMSVELGQGMGRPRAEMWFERVMALDPNNYEACVAMSNYLEPRWYGSDEEALKFARKCVVSKRWGGAVPLVLQKIHHTLAAYHDLWASDKYWHRPYVWPDIQASYEKYFQLNPQDLSFRHNYARDAFKCGKYQAFLDELPRFATGTNFNFFGGQTNFAAMVSKAQKTVDR